MTLPDARARILEHYVSTHSSVSGAVETLARRRPWLDRLVARHFPDNRDAVILDLGCGHGAILEAAQRAGYRNATGVDASPEQVEAARTLGIAGVRQGELTETLAGLAPDSHDAIITFDLLHYFPPDEQVAIIDAVHRALKPGGRWIIHVPNGEALFAGRMRYWDYLAAGAFTRASIAQILRASGFRAVACYEDTPAAHGLKSAIRWLGWKVIRGGLRAYLMVETGESGREAIFSQCLLAVAEK